MSQPREVLKTPDKGDNRDLQAAGRLFEASGINDRVITDGTKQSYANMDRAALTELLATNEAAQKQCFAPAAEKARALPQDVLASFLTDYKDNPFQSQANTDAAMKLLKQHLVSV